MPQSSKVVVLDNDLSLSSAFEGSLPSLNLLRVVALFELIVRSDNNFGEGFAMLVLCSA